MRFDEKSIENINEKHTNNKKNTVTVFFEAFNNKNKKNKIIKAVLKKGQNLLKAAHNPIKTYPKKVDIPLEGACEGSLACSTCHVILDEDLYKKFREPVDKEYDLLDTAFMPTDTSRLGCQLIIDSKFNNETVKIPRAGRNFAVDGFINKHH